MTHDSDGEISNAFLLKEHLKTDLRDLERGLDYRASEDVWEGLREVKACLRAGSQMLIQRGTNREPEAIALFEKGSRILADLRDARRKQEEEEEEERRREEEISRREDERQGRILGIIGAVLALLTVVLFIIGWPGLACFCLILAAVLLFVSLCYYWSCRGGGTAEPE